MKFSRFVLISAICLAGFASSAPLSWSQLQISQPRTNSVVPGEVIEISGTGADPTATLEVEVLTNDWYLQDGKSHINPDGSWTFSPVHLAGKGPYNNHTIRVTQIKDGRRGRSVSVTGIVRKQ